jgi:adenosylmethionine-8-amino-7-oxononanoate aminotransferase
MNKHLFPFSRNNPAPNIKTSTIVTDYGFMDGYTNILDLGLGSSGCFPLGFRRTDIIDSVCEKLKQNPFCQSDFATSNRYVDLLSEKLYEVSNGYHSIFSMSGSDSIEGAIKIAKLYSNRNKIIGFENSYHGSTYMSASVSGSTYLTDTFGKHSDCVTISYTELDKIDNDTLAVIIETCSWQNGIELLPGRFYNELRKRCDETGALLIIDDIAFCNGKTGTHFGWQVLPIKPDIFCIGKGITGGYFPLSATLFNQKVADIVRPKVLLHGFAYSFPMSGIISALEYFDILEREKIFDNYTVIIDKMNNVCNQLYSQQLITGYRHFGVCYNILLNKPINDLWEKEQLFYKHGLHIGVWNNYKNGILIMLPLNANDQYFSDLITKVTKCLTELNQQS